MKQEINPGREVFEESKKLFPQTKAFFPLSKYLSKQNFFKKSSFS